MGYQIPASANRERQQFASINLKSYENSESEPNHNPQCREISSPPKEIKKEQDSKLKKSTKKVPNRGSPYSVAPVQEEVLASRVLRKLANLGNFLSEFCLKLDIKNLKKLKNEKIKMN